MTGPERPIREFVSRIRELAVADSSRAWLEATFDAGDERPLDRSRSIRAVTGATAVVVGSAHGMWLRHVEQLRSHLAAHHGAATADSDAAQVARAASDIDAAELQLTEFAIAHADLEQVVVVCRQVVARARAAADRLLEHSRHALDADDPATRRWGEVDAGARRAVHLFDDIAASLR
ncbi:hypothetical protein EUA04_25600 [Mycolicibacterium obuense]|uniref:Uncharacterized protein n=1 Tax=Mycolicibacterium obuense TaxID=1807 RepID=A0A0M2JVK8_9MYCO|nr:hypothetical protein [Mycolicibacterium obuense]KKF01100.1 hypothetical protein WN67_15360 [Mycolicibacterium obuense]TDL03306.1 hypothetical protein EUA04_25600 [Mycolicibacterium obuense]